jgi:hypothetical protein
MALPIVPVIISALGALVTATFGFCYKFLGYWLAKRLAIGSATVALVSAATLAMAQSIKLLILGTQVVLPAKYAAGLAFLPPNLNQILAIYISVRITHFIFQWSMKNLARYTMQISI